MSTEPSDSCELSIVREDGLTIATVPTNNLLGLPEVNLLSAQLRNLLEAGDIKLILDLGRVQYAGSAALGMLLSVDQELRSRGGMLVLVNVGKVETLLKVSRTRAVFNVAADLPAAQRMAQPPE